MSSPVIRFRQINMEDFARRYGSCLCFEHCLGVAAIHRARVGDYFYNQVAISTYIASTRATCHMAQFPQILQILNMAKDYVIEGHAMPTHDHNYVWYLGNELAEQLRFHYLMNCTSNPPPPPRIATPHQEITQ